MAENQFMTLGNGMTVALGICASLITVGFFVNDFKRDIQQSRTDVSNLEKQVAEIRSRLPSPEDMKGGRSIGVQGPQGEAGPIGPRGPKGDQGEPGLAGPSGNTTSTHDVEALRTEIESLKLSLNSISDGPTRASPATPSPISSNAPVECLPYPRQTSGLFTIASETRICNSDGVYLATATLRGADSVRFTKGNAYRRCDVGKPCYFFDDTGAQYIYDGPSKASDGGVVAKFSVYPN